MQVIKSPVGLLPARAGETAERQAALRAPGRHQHQVQDHLQPGHCQHKVQHRHQVQDHH